MEVTNCKDINGNSISEITLNNDGTVLAVLEVNGVSSTSKLSSECCTSNGYTFDPTDAKCYWSTTCDTGGSYKIILDPEGNSGAYFQVDENQKDFCTLEVEFDYLLKFDCANVAQIIGTIDSLKLELSLEKVIYDETLPIPNNLESVQKEDIINVNSDNFSTFLSGNTNTGLLLDGDGCEALILNFINTLPPEEIDWVTDTSFNSTWVRHKMIINDPEILESIYNEYLKIVIIGDKLSNFSILVDNIKLNRICESDAVEGYLKDECPKFDLKRVIDNKKSWVGEEITETREFDLSRRETNYSINNERLSINTKEIDLLINPSSAVENDVWEFTKENPCILSAATGCTIDTHECIDMTELMSTPVEEIIDGVDLLNQLIDVKTRKTLSSYPLIELLYYRYINSESHCGAKSNALSEESVETFVDLVASFWSDIIEQVVPATTIWGSSFQHSNNIFGADKFVYKKSSLNPCYKPNYKVPSPTVPMARPGDSPISEIDIITVDVTNIDYFEVLDSVPQNLIQRCSGAYIIQTNDGSEFLGSVTVIGDGGDNTITGNTLTINETIGSSCDIYIGDFNSCDFDNNDWYTPIPQ